MRFPERQGRRLLNAAPIGEHESHEKSVGSRRSLFAEQKRRNVVKVSAADLALGWVVVEVTNTNTVTPLLNGPA